MLSTRRAAAPTTTTTTWDETNIHPLAPLPTIRVSSSSSPRPTPWTRVEFTNSARPDGLQLRRWEKQDKMQMQHEYPFAQLGKEMTPVATYTQEQYERLGLGDSQWTRQETDLLFRLCGNLDLRWQVVTDRYRHITSKAALPKRSVADLKERYYTVAGKLAHSAEAGILLGCGTTPHTFPRLLHRLSPAQIQAAELGLRTYTYDKARDLAYFDHLDRQFHQTRQLQEEEAQVVAALQRVDAELRQIVQAEAKKEKIKRKPVSHKKKSTTEEEVQSGDEEDLNESMLESALAAHHDGPVSLRSTRVDLTNSTVHTLGLGYKTSAKLSNMLRLLGLPEEVVPTASVCGAYNELRRNVVKMMVLTQTLKQKQQTLDGMMPPRAKSPELVVPSSSPAPVSGVGATSTTTATASSSLPIPQQQKPVSTTPVQQLVAAAPAPSLPPPARSPQTVTPPIPQPVVAPVVAPSPSPPTLPSNHVANAVPAADEDSDDDEDDDFSPETNKKKTRSGRTTAATTTDSKGRKRRKKA